MDKINFSSEFHPFGNYLIKFRRSDLRSQTRFDIINIIEIYSQEKNKIMDLKFDIKTTIYLYGILLGLTNEFAEFEYELPIYNTMGEITRISGIIGYRLPNDVMPKFNAYMNSGDEYQRNMAIEEEIYDNSFPSATIIISKEKDEEKIAEVAATFNLVEFDEFIYIFYFLLLIDVIDIDDMCQFYR